MIKILNKLIKMLINRIKYQILVIKEDKVNMKI